MKALSFTFHAIFNASNDEWKNETHCTFVRLKNSNICNG